LVPPFTLELRVDSGTSVLQEIQVCEGEAFRVTTLKQKERWVAEGIVGPIVDGMAIVNIEVSVFGPHPGTSAHLGRENMKLKIDEFSGTGFAVFPAVAMVSDLWLRRGTDPIPPLIRQLSAEQGKAAMAAKYLGAHGADAKAALPALQKAAERDDKIIRTAAQTALRDILRKVLDEAK
jgi:hypothetical protein